VATAAEPSYEDVVRRTRELVEELTPPGATVVVVSKGDDSLVRFDGRAGWHFPRAASGQYAGHHPPDGPWAIEHLERLRAAGGAYFVLPATYLWWLEHYPELEGHLAARYEPIAHEDGACLVYRLLELPATSPRAVPDLLQGPRGDKVVHAMRALVCNLLPDDAVVLVASDGDDSLLELGRTAWHFPHDASGVHVPLDVSDGKYAVTQLRTLGRRGVRYLLVPSSGFSTLARCPELGSYLGGEECRMLALRSRICTLFDLGCDNRQTVVG
jgi:hypothetical protein